MISRDWYNFVVKFLARIEILRKGMEWRAGQEE